MIRIFIFLLMLGSLQLSLAETTQQKPTTAQQQSKTSASKTQPAASHTKQTKKNKQRLKSTKAKTKNEAKKTLTSTQPKTKTSSTLTAQPTNSHPQHHMLSFTQKLVDLVRRTIHSVNYSSYRLGGSHFDTSNGIYVIDCSQYVDHLLQQSYPHAYSDLIRGTRINNPTTLRYYDFFTQLPNKSKNDWKRIDDARQVQPGDILVFRYKSLVGRNSGGHVMVIMDKAISEADVLKVRVADSAPAGHSDDTREVHTSGIGEGALLLKINTKTGEPYAYAWKEGARWESDVDFAIARPVKAT